MQRQKNCCFEEVVKVNWSWNGERITAFSSLFTGLTDWFIHSFDTPKWSLIRGFFSWWPSSFSLDTRPQTYTYGFPSDLGLVCERTIRQRAFANKSTYMSAKVIVVALLKFNFFISGSRLMLNYWSFIEDSSLSKGTAALLFSEPEWFHCRWLRFITFHKAHLFL
jgi:hypothetical protein